MAVILLLQMLAPLALPGAAAARTLDAALDGDHIVVCTVSGIMVLDRDGKPAGPAADSPSGFCMFCLPLMHGGTDMPAGGVGMAPPSAPGVVPLHPPVAGLEVTREPLAGAASPQAPPSV